MKKVLFIFLLIIVFLLPVDIYGKERVVPDPESSNYLNIEYLGKRQTFNYMEFQYNEYVEERLNYFNEILSNNSSTSNISNSINYNMVLIKYSNAGENIGYIELNITYKINKNKIIKILASIDDVTMIEVSISDESYSLSKNYIDFIECDNNVRLVSYTGFSVWSEYSINDMFKIRPDIFIVILYDYTYNSDVYIPAFSDLKAEEIINEVGLIDSFNDRLIEYDFIECNYFKNSNVGNYKIKIRGYNREKQVIFKWIYVHVIDIDDIAKASNFSTSCNKKIEDLEIIEGLDIKREYESINISSEYHYCSNKKGRYKYIANIKFSDMNLLLPGTIDVVDIEKPYGIVTPKLITVPNDSCLTKEDILKRFVIYDDHDGYISPSNITLNGFINYLASYSALNDHEINLVAKDSSNNIYEYNFILRVTDDKSYSELERYDIPKYISHDLENNSNDNSDINVIDEAKEESYNPVISNSNYVIRAYTTHKLTASEVQDLLISDGYLNNNDVVLIDSEYFREANPKAGSFSLSVTYQNGDTTYYEINLVEKEEIKEEEKSYTGLIVSIIIGSVVLIALIIIVIMRVYVHVKKN